MSKADWGMSATVAWRDWSGGRWPLRMRSQIGMYMRWTVTGAVSTRWTYQGGSVLASDGNERRSARGKLGTRMRIYEIGERKMLTQSTGNSKISQAVIGGMALGEVKADPGERRQFIRYAFTATFEAIEPNSGTRINGRTADMSEGGCYVDTMSPLPAGTVLKVRISKENRALESQATVVYAVAGMGMGLRFESIVPQQLAIVKRWLGELRGETPVDMEAEKEEPRACGGPTGPQNNSVLNELIGELMRKGVLDDSMGREMLQRLG